MILKINEYEVLLDKEQFEAATKHKWRIKKSGNSITPYIIIDGKIKCISKVIFGLDSDHNVFHKNGNCLDYRKQSIIICNKKQLAYLVSNCKNKNKASKYYGVIYRKDRGKWCTTIRSGSKIKSYDFSSEEEAALIADYFAITNYGDVAKRNFPNLSYEQIKEKYYELKKKYGFTREEKITKSQQGIPKKPTSKFVGICFDKSENKWRTLISYKGKRISMGRHDNEIDAARAYDTKALELYGRDARLNFPLI